MKHRYHDDGEDTLENLYSDAEPFRPAHGLVNVPRLEQCGDDQKLKFSRLLWPYKLIVVAGAHKIGKTSTLQQYIPQPGWSYSFWRREPILNMLHMTGETDESYYSNIARLEKEIFTDLLLKSQHQVIIEGWFRFPNNRRRVLGWNRNVSSMILVFDGPSDLVLDRANTHSPMKDGMSEAEFKDMISKHCYTTSWPTKKEGWDRIQYVNTFGKRGEQYLANTLYLI